jgi:hypothetical protein
LPERRGVRLPGTVCLHNHTGQCMKGGVPSNGTPPQKVEEK